VEVSDVCHEYFVRTTWLAKTFSYLQRLMGENYFKDFLDDLSLFDDGDFVSDVICRRLTFGVDFVVKRVFFITAH